MATFYKQQRLNGNILIKDQDKPVGGKWSFDEDNRKKLAKGLEVPKVPSFKKTDHTKQLISMIEKEFASHPGSLEFFNYPTTRKDTVKLFLDFLKNKLKQFGDYEDSITQKSHTVFHSMLSPVMNLGLLTPQTVVKETIAFAKANKVPLNSLEGFVRQVIGWREFMRGIYQNYEQRLVSDNFFNHKKINKKLV